MDSTWFVVEDPEADGEEPWNFDADELTFISALQGRAASWRVQRAPSDVGRPEDDSSLLVHVSLVDSDRSISLGEWAVHFHGTHVLAGKVRDQLFNIDRRPERGFFRATGTAQELAERCAQWFEAILSRPVSRTEWHNQGREYATAWHFADNLEGLVGSGNFHDRHTRCVLLRGATRPQDTPHSPLCPHGPDLGVVPSRGIAASQAPAPLFATKRDRWRFRLRRHRN
ncbi:hypothetical protein U9R90_18820 [Streptomyces sp. E11-3]|uniref:hypothetical protein n=1 Tax=Streptomyces sp. E11-3 TaxID=3110112 RepID=UPI00397F1F23